MTPTTAAPPRVSPVVKVLLALPPFVPVGIWAGFGKSDGHRLPLLAAWGASVVVLACARWARGFLSPLLASGGGTAIVLLLLGPWDRPPRPPTPMEMEAKQLRDVSAALLRATPPVLGPARPIGAKRPAPVTAHQVLFLRSLLFQERWDELLDSLTAYRLAAEADVAHEARWYEVYDATFGNGDAPFYEAMVRFARARPDRRETSIALGFHYLGTAWTIRGTGLASGIPPERRRFFHQALYAAERNANEVLGKEPSDLTAYWLLLAVAQVEGDQEASRVLLDRALIISPLSAVSYRLHLIALPPRWGGSEEEVLELFDEIAPKAKQNPALRPLAGYLEADIAHEAGTPAHGGTPDSGLAHLRAALAFGPAPRFYREMGSFYTDEGRFTAAVAVYDSAIALLPTDEELYGYQSYALGQLLGADSGSAPRLRRLRLRDSLVGVRLRNGFPEFADTTGIP